MGGCRLVPAGLEFAGARSLSSLGVIIRAATCDAADYVGLLDDLGTVEKGKLADLLIVDGDPLEDISEIRKIKMVIQAGRIVHERQESQEDPLPGAAAPKK